MILGWIATAAAWESWAGEAMHTRWQLSLPDGSGAEAERVFAVIREVEASASEWRPETPIGRLNRAAGSGERVALPAEVEALLRTSVELARKTDGAFDPTWAALWSLWDFSRPRLPSPAERAAAVAHVGWSRLELGEGWARLPEAGMAVGLGGIAKGWALDRAAALLRAAGHRDFLLVAGGQVYAGGLKDGRPWQVGVRDPRGAETEIFATLPVSDRSVSTSGDYERFFELDGVRWHHILDPRSGLPSTRARAATVSCPDGTTADALSTALVVLGPAGLARLADFPGCQGLVVDPEGGLHQSAGLPLVTLRAPRR